MPRFTGRKGHAGCEAISSLKVTLIIGGIKVMSSIRFTATYGLVALACGADAGR